MWFFKNSLLINPSICHWFVMFSLSHTNFQNILGMVFLAFLLCFFRYIQNVFVQAKEEILCDLFQDPLNI